MHAKKQIFRAWKIVLLQSRACLMGWPEDRERTVATFHFWVSQGQCQKNNFADREKKHATTTQAKPQPRTPRLLFCATIGICPYVMFLFPNIDFEWTGSSASIARNIIFQSPKMCFFPKPDFYPTRTHSIKREPQRGITTFQFPSHNTYKLLIWNQIWPRKP